MYRDNKKVAMLAYEDAEDLAEDIGQSIYKWMKKNPNTTVQVVSDLVLASLEGYISGSTDTRKEDEEE